MEKVQTDINISMRAILVDWLVEVSEDYRLIPDTLYLTVNYIDRYLSGNMMDRQRLQFLGVACMMIASKYEEICPPQVEEFCYITDNTYFKDEVFEMESAVLNFLEFELTAPTVKCFLRRFVRAAQRVTEDQKKFNEQTNADRKQHSLQGQTLLDPLARRRQLAVSTHANRANGKPNRRLSLNPHQNGVLH